MLKVCPNCKSGKYPFILYDRMGICCGYVCSHCVNEKKKKYNPAIFKTDTKDYRQIVMESGESFDPDE